MNKSNLNWKARFRLTLLRAFVALVRRLGVSRDLSDFHVSERILEYPFVHANIPPGRHTALDVGSGLSSLSLELASRGHQVYAMDLSTPYPLSHPNLRYVQQDIRRTSFTEGFFSLIVAISTVEHIGLGNPMDEAGDRKALLEMLRICKVGGRVILTFPFGKAGIAYLNGSPSYRVYDSKSLANLVSGFEVEKIEYGLKTQNNWGLASLEEVKDVDSTINAGGWVKAIAMVVIRKGA